MGGNLGLASLESFDMSGYNQDEFSYNFNLEVPEPFFVKGVKDLLNLGKKVPVTSPWSIPIKIGIETLDKLTDYFTHEKLVKPQRKKLIEDYFQGSLKPEFENQLENIENSIINSIRQTLNSAAEEKINEANTAFETLRTEKETLKTEFTQRIDTLQEYKKILESQ